MLQAEAGTTVTVTVASPEGSKLYDVPGTVMQTGLTDAPGGAYAKWKAFLKPAPAGGNFTVSVSCREQQIGGSGGSLEPPGPLS